MQNYTPFITFNPSLVQKVTNSKNNHPLKFEPSGALEYSLSNSLSEGLSGVEHPADKSFDHDLYNNVLSSNIYGTLSSLTGRLISGLKVLDDSTLTKNEEKENQENVDTRILGLIFFPKIFRNIF